MIDLDRAELARERHDHREAVLSYDRALVSLPKGEFARRLVAHRGRASSLYRLGQAQEAVADFVEARRLAQQLADYEGEVEILLDHATALDWGNDVPASEALVREAETVALQLGVQARSVRAGLSMARGRILFRAGRWPEACAALQQAVLQAELLGAAGYESLVVSLLLLEVVLPNLGRMEEAEAASARVVALTTDRRDLLNLSSALNNRRNLLVARGDVAAAIADQQQFMAIGRDLGLVLNEYFAEYNMGELLYQAGDVTGAADHVLRATAFETSHPAIASRPVAALLKARLLAFQGLVAEARKLLGEIQQATAQAQQAGHPEGALSPSEEVLATMVDLATRDATEAEWDALVTRSQGSSLEQEPIEILEMRARSARRSGKAGEADEAIGRALELAARIPNVMEPRLKQFRDARG